MSDALIVLFESLLLAAALGASALFSSAETAFFSLGALQVRRLDGHGAAATLVGGILRTPNRLLSGLLIGNTLVNVLASTLTFLLLRRVTPYAAELTTVGLTLFLLVFGEVGPKRVALLWPERLALWYARPLHGFLTVVRPLAAALESLTRALDIHFTPPGSTGGRHLSEEELATILKLSGEEGIIDRHEDSMVRAIMRLSDLRAADVMTPRVDLMGLDLDDSPADPAPVVGAARVRFLPLYRGDLDEIEAVLDVRAYLLDPRRDLSAARREPRYVPETVALDRLLERMQAERFRVAVVVDEYGGTAGMISRGDILETITGIVSDDYQGPELKLQPQGPNQWLAAGDLALDVLNAELGLHLEAESSDRLAGWIHAQLERLPLPGEILAAQGVRVTVQRLRGHRIQHVLLERLPPAAGEPDQEERL
ncbi:MAG: hemolysin family protein [Candidatus Marinimicrobia bacterium]|nr:hemolysin family protein [Candidatus Neomarinimicrobiota bacterium]